MGLVKIINIRDGMVAEKIKFLNDYFSKAYLYISIHLLEKNIDKIDWESLCVNPEAIHLLEENIEEIDWDVLSSNPNIFYNTKPTKSALANKV